MVGPLSIRGDCDGDADDAKEHEDESPPGKVWEAAMDGGYYGADERDDPGKLWTRLAMAGRWADALETHDADGDGGEGERVANDAAEAEARRPLAVGSVIHFGE
jgi:hypothetical protein